MKPRTRLSPAQTKELLRLYTETSETTTAIAARFSVDNSYPTVLARRSGVKMRAPDHGRRPKGARS